MTGDVFKTARLERAIWAAKLMLLCVGTVSTLVFFKAAIIPYLVSLCLHIAPQLWTSFKSCCLSPLYIYIILNFIIITIVASSTFQGKNQNQKQHLHPPSSSFSSSVASSSSFISDNAANTSDNIDSSNSFICSPDDDNRDDKYNSGSIQSQSLSQQQHSIQGHSKEDIATAHDNHDQYYSNNEMLSWHDIHIVQAHVDKEAEEEEEEDQEESISNCIMSSTALTSTSLLPLDEYDHHRFDPSPETCSGGDLLEEMPTAELDLDVGESINTLDTTWKAIMEGQGKPMGKQLKKSDTWDTPPRLTGQLALKNSRTNKLEGREQELQVDHHNYLNVHERDRDEEGDDAVTWARRELKKSDTFSDRASLRREKSMTQEELNQRAEAFIKKFNNDIRLQRLESDQRRFKEIVNRGL